MFDNAEMKYIVIESQGCECPVIFDKLISHHLVANNLTVNGKVLSAGFLNVYMKEQEDGFHAPSVGCYGRSVTLKLTSREEKDSALIQRRLIYVP